MTCVVFTKSWMFHFILQNNVSRNLLFTARACLCVCEGQGAEKGKTRLFKYVDDPINYLLLGA